MIQTLFIAVHIAQELISKLEKSGKSISAEEKNVIMTVSCYELLGLFVMRLVSKNSCMCETHPLFTS